MALIRPIRRIVKVACARNLVRRGIRSVAEVGAWGVTRLRARRHRRRQPASKAVTIPDVTTPQADIWHCATPPEAGRYWASTQGNRFHTPVCRWAAQITPDHRLCIRDREAATRAGYISPDPALARSLLLRVDNLGVVLIRERQRDVEGAALVDLALHPHASVVPFDDRLDQRQP